MQRHSSIFGPSIIFFVRISEQGTVPTHTNQSFLTEQFATAISFLIYAPGFRWMIFLYTGKRH